MDANPNIPDDFFMPGLKALGGVLYQIVAPDGRAVVNFLPHYMAWRLLSYMQHNCPSVLFKMQKVPQDELFPPSTDDQTGDA